MLSSESQRTLSDAGFTRYEIRAYHNATYVNTAGFRVKQPPADLNSPLWQEVISKRIERVERITREYQRKTGKEMPKSRLGYLLNLWYAKHKKADPFDWLKRAYRRILRMSAKEVRKATRRLQTFPGARKYEKKALPQFFD